jgi:hypothetical protein
VIAGLLDIIDDRGKAESAASTLTSRLPGYAPMWHITRAARAADPAGALRGIRDELDAAVARSVAAAAQWVAKHGGPVAVAPGSSVITQVLGQLDPRITEGTPALGLAGADAIGRHAVLNARGTGELARRLPTLVVTTSLKLVPEAVFAQLEASPFERVPLSSFAAVVLDGAILHPDIAGQRAEALAG